MTDIINRQDADMKLFSLTWKKLHDHIASKLKNKADNRFHVSADLDGVTYRFKITTLNPGSSWSRSEIMVFRKPSKKLWFIEIAAEQWADEPDSYRSVGLTDAYFGAKAYYMTWEEMFVFLACREDILAKLLYEVEKRNRKETERRTPFEELAEKHKVSLEGIKDWLKVVPT